MRHKSNNLDFPGRKRFAVCPWLGFLVLLAGLFAPSGAAWSYPEIPDVQVTTLTLSSIPMGHAVSARDGGASFRFAGESVFTFGDTVCREQNSEGTAWVTNSMFHTSDTLCQDGFQTGFNYKDPAKSPLVWIPFTQAEKDYNASGAGIVGLWPTSPFKDPNTNKQYLWFGKVLEHPSVGFEGVGGGFCEVVSLTSNTVRIQHRPGEAEDYLMFDGGNYGDIAVVSDGYLYGYYMGQWATMYLARAPLAGEGFKDRSNWTFRCNNEWVSNATSATVIATLATVGSIEWNQYLNCWLYTHMGFLDNRMVMQVADNLWGPWSAPKAVFTAPKGRNNGLPYFGRAQRIFEENEGRTQFISYSNALGASGTGEGVVFQRLDFPRPATVSGSAWAKYR